MQTEVNEIHEREGEVIENVSGRDHRIELDRVEQHGLVVDQDDVAEMGIAMAAAHQPGRRPRFQTRQIGFQMPVAQLVQTLDRLARQRGLRAEFLGVAIDDGGDGSKPARAVGDVGRTMRIARAHPPAPPQLGLQMSGAREMVECLALVEPRHLHGPFDHGAVAADLGTIAPLRDRNDAAIDVGREAAIDREFLLAGAPCASPASNSPGTAAAPRA